jgi:hypothetical protein
MPPKTTSTVLLDELRRLGFRDASSVALSSRTARLAAEQAALGVDVVDDHPGDVGVGEPHERERAGLVRDDSHLDGLPSRRS